MIIKSNKKIKKCNIRFDLLGSRFHRELFRRTEKSDRKK